MRRCARRSRALAAPAAARPDAAPAPHAHVRSPARYLWAVLLARIYEILPLRCALCGSEMRIIAFVTDGAGDPFHPQPTWASPPPLPRWPRHVARRCGSRPPSCHWDDTPAPAPEYVFDQRVSW